MNVLTINDIENYHLKAANAINKLISFYMLFLCHSYVIVCRSYVILMSLACNPHATLMYSHVIRMSLVCTHMSSVCHSQALLCHPYVSRMYSYVIRMSLVCYITMKPSKVATAKNLFSSVHVIDTNFFDKRFYSM